MHVRRTLLFLCLLAAMLLLSSCAATSLPITEREPSVTLPPAKVSFVAPIGDASLEYSSSIPFYLPDHDGLSLTPVESTVAFSPVRPDAETVVRALLAFAGDRNASAVGRDVKLSLYGTNPVEVSRDTVTVNLSASALQLDRESLFIACQSIANTLTSLDNIRYVNVLVVDKPVGLDIANTLPMGALTFNASQDLGAVYEQLLSRRVAVGESAVNKPFSAVVPLYFPVLETDGLVCEARSMSFENQLLPDMVTAILQALAKGPQDQKIASPELPLLADLLNATPRIMNSEEAGGSILMLEFAHNLDDMLEAYGVSRQQCIASLCYTFSTFLPNVRGVGISINGTPVDRFLLTEDDGPETNDLQLRADFSEMLLDYCTLYLPYAETGELVAVRRPIAYNQCRNPRALLSELSRGPQACDSRSDTISATGDLYLADTDMLGFALAGNTLLCNFAPSFTQLAQTLDAEEERTLAYALVNTLCMGEPIRSVCFFQAGSQFDGFSGEIYWAGLFYPIP